MIKRCKAVISISGFLFFVTIISLDLAWGSSVFGPKNYTRSTSPPQIITDSFSATPGTQYKLIITNNGLSDSATESVGDSFIYLNGNNVVGTQNFSQSTTTLEVPVELQANNTLRVEVRGTAGGSITVLITTDL